MRAFTLMALCTLAATPAFAQSTTAPITPAALRTVSVEPDRLVSPRLLLPEPSSTRGQTPRFQNVRLDLTITDTYTGEPTRKTVSMLALMGEGGMIRTTNRLPSGHEVGLNVDATVGLVADGQLKVRVTFEYTPAQSQGDSTPRAPGPAELHESLTVVVADGQTLQISQSADPATDRKVTVELTATVVR